MQNTLETRTPGFSTLSETMDSRCWIAQSLKLFHCLLLASDSKSQVSPTEMPRIAPGRNGKMKLEKPTWEGGLFEFSVHGPGHTVNFFEKSTKNQRGSLEDYRKMMDGPEKVKEKDENDDDIDNPFQRSLPYPKPHVWYP
ncbi:hypothetical protein RUM43_001892 [Polyplax serrata]|uniref:Uncharacterized protein n=1 Tax=Polyplax serrata TaxID=468196 RepID=A0AAN8XUQ1_POLSC